MKEQTTFSLVEMKRAKTLKLLEEAKANIADAQTRQKEQYDRKHSPTGPSQSGVSSCFCTMCTF